ncbi:hypothetical protein EVAR_26848_1 [Eumeta japonica]|uniref:Uncharacterized protein n=1 Tax=Eumeta variegata TaxID=151549 RepID=A0A4C1VWL2_EUMVA|nr:hypothetical protein EVAR_26848_1 [Eumeta japonica]
MATVRQSIETKKQTTIDLRQDSRYSRISHRLCRNRNKRKAGPGGLRLAGGEGGVAAGDRTRAGDSAMTSRRRAARPWKFASAVSA